MEAGSFAELLLEGGVQSSCKVQFSSPFTPMSTLLGLVIMFERIAFSQIPERRLAIVQRVEHLRFRRDYQRALRHKFGLARRSSL